MHAYPDLSISALFIKFKKHNAKTKEIVSLNVHHFIFESSVHSSWQAIGGGPAGEGGELCPWEAGRRGTIDQNNDNHKNAAQKWQKLGASASVIGSDFHSSLTGRTGMWEQQTSIRSPIRPQGNCEN